jgi:hypothetical protein
VVACEAPGPSPPGPLSSDCTGPIPVGAQGPAPLRTRTGPLSDVPLRRLHRPDPCRGAGLCAPTDLYRSALYQPIQQLHLFDLWRGTAPPCPYKPSPQPSPKGRGETRIPPPRPSPKGRGSSIRYSPFAIRYSLFFPLATRCSPLAKEAPHPSPLSQRGEGGERQPHRSAPRRAVRTSPTPGEGRIEDTAEPLSPPYSRG